MKKISVRYFALFREQANKNMETIYTNAKTAKELFDELSVLYGFSLSCDQIQVAINEEFQPLASPIRAKDSVVFIPPVAGG